MLLFQIDDYTAYFQTNNLTLILHDKYSLLQQENIEILSDQFIYGGTKMGNMYLYGSTIGRTRYPTFIYRGIKKNYLDQLLNQDMGAQENHFWKQNDFNIYLNKQKKM